MWKIHGNTLYFGDGPGDWVAFPGDVESAVRLCERHNEIEHLARGLLARLSHDYGDSEDCPLDVALLFERGERLLPVQGGKEGA